MADCPIDYHHVLDKDHYKGQWSLDDLWPSWVLSGLLFLFTFVIPFLLIHLGVWWRMQKQLNDVKAKKQEDSDVSAGRDSDWEDEGIPFVTNMAEYLRTNAPADYVEKFERQKDGPPVIRIPGTTSVAVQTENFARQHERKPSKSSRKEETQPEEPLEKAKSQEKKLKGQEKKTSKRKTPSKGREESLSIQSIVQCSTKLHDSAMRPSLQTSTGKKSADAAMPSERTQESER